MSKVKEKIQFGKYPIDAEGKDIEPISWIVLKKTKESMLLLSENIIDYKVFSENSNNDWEQSDLRKWLIGEFFEFAFSKEEKERMKELFLGDKVSLLEFDDNFNTSYFPTLTSLKSSYTDYARSKTKNIYGAVNKDKFGFWWLRSANKDYPSNPHVPFDTTVYVFHICNTGRLNGYMVAKNKDGVRPIICINI